MGVYLAVVIGVDYALCRHSRTSFLGVFMMPFYYGSKARWGLHPFAPRYLNLKAAQIL